MLRFTLVLLLLFVLNTMWFAFISLKYMGTTFPKKQKRGIQFSTYVEKGKQKQIKDGIERWEQLEQPYECCGFKYKKTIRRKVTWQSLFIANCQDIQSQFEWAKDLKQMVVNCTLSKDKYLREMVCVKTEAFTDVGNDEVLQNEQELQRFKRNLKKSVLISMNGSFINNKTNKKSNVSQQQKMISTISKTDKQNKSRFQFERYRGSGVSSFMEVMLRKSVASLMDDTITQIMGIQKQISKKNAKQLEVFLKFTMMLQNHLNDMSCTLGKIQKLFILYIQKHYRSVQKAGKDIGHFVDSIKQYLLLIRESVVDYYGLHLFRQMSQGGNMFISNQQNVLSALTAILFKDNNFYSVIFDYISAFNMERQAQFMDILNNLKDCPPERFYIKQKFCLNIKTIDCYLDTMIRDADPDIPFDIQDVVIQNTSTPYNQCINSLRQLAKTKSPINKMKAIMACSQNITQQIEKFYYQHGLKRQNWILDADQVLSIFCYIIVNAKVQNLHSHLFILENFATSHQIISMTGYYLSVISCAVEQIKNDYGSDMRLSKQEV